MQNFKTYYYQSIDNPVCVRLWLPEYGALLDGAGARAAAPRRPRGRARRSARQAIAPSRPRFADSRRDSLALLILSVRQAVRAEAHGAARHERPRARKDAATDISHNCTHCRMRST